MATTVNPVAYQAGERVSPVRRTRKVARAGAVPPKSALARP
jgi:hypothetical protein